MKEISDELYNQLKKLGIIDADTRSHNVGASDYSKHLFQPWVAWIEYNLNAFDADILTTAWQCPLCQSKNYFETVIP